MNYLEISLLLIALTCPDSAETTPASAVDQLMDAVEAGDEATRLKAIKGLESVDRAVKVAAEQLMQIFLNRRETTKVRLLAFQTHMAIFFVPRARIDDLVAIAKRKDEPAEVRQAALSGVHMLARKRQSKDVAARLLEIVTAKHDDATVRGFAAMTVIQLPLGVEQARQAQRTVIGVLKDRKDSTELRIGIAQMITVVLLCPIINSPSPIHAAATSIDEMIATLAARDLVYSPSPADAEAAQAIGFALLDVAQDRTEPLPLRFRAAESLVDLFLHAHSSKLDLKQLPRRVLRWSFDALGDSTENRKVRRRAGCMLPFCGSPFLEPPGEKFLPGLIKLLRHKDRFVHLYAANAAVGLIGAKAQAAVPALRKVQDDPKEDQPTRDAARAALTAINRQ